MKILKANKAITLIALVITIIILLILAGITVVQLSGNNLFENAKLAKEKYQKSRELEDDILGDYEDAITGDRGSKINYSTEEQDTGVKWIDGSSIYQKTYTSSTVQSAGNINIDILQNIKLLNATGHFVNNADGNTLVLGYYNSNVGHKANGQLYLGSDYSISGYNITIQYIKINNSNN